MTQSVPIGLPQSIFDLPLEERVKAVLGSHGVGLQSSLFAEARDILREKLLQKMAERREEEANEGTEQKGSRRRKGRKTSIVVAYTSNLISCGLRETFASLAKAKVVDAFVSTAGGVEEDVIKCLGDTIVGDFALKGADLRQQGLNRVGNLIIPNDNYIDFETFFVPVIKQMHLAQLASDWAPGTTGPSALIRLMGETLGKPSSDAYLQEGPVDEATRRTLRDKAAQELSSSQQSAEALEKEIQSRVDAKVSAIGLELTRSASLVCSCARNKIPIYCPALTDGSMGDMICFYSFNKKGFVCDPCEDYKCLVDIVGDEDEDSSEEEIEHDILVLALGAGLPRNHALHLTPASGTYALPNSNSRNKKKEGDDKPRTATVKRTVLQIVTSQDVDGCNSGAQLVDDTAEGLINSRETVIRVHGDASLLLPMMIGGLVQ